MASKAKIKGHPIHPILVALPIGMWGFTFFSDIIYFAGGGDAWREASLRTAGVGVIAALAAAIPGAIDLFSWSKSRVKTIGTWHGALNVVITGAFAVSFFLRLGGVPVAGWPFVLVAAGVLLLDVTGWLGGSMVYVHRAAIEPHAAPGAPGKEAPAREKETVSAGKE